eukprot:TRINITY_DN8731_c0_g2_i1.p1 TRINITY_DN8731_c0_g2~~TRINITY_DN8731_c0_g2_i1.p1  ORF type:complete len:324 (+),score=42.36 TRINITY_DN8731_c0_g2_i1:82-1053(+)
MIVLAIDDNWYFFLLFAGLVLIITIIVLVVEKRSDDEEILKTKPLIVIRNITLNQLTFYAIYLLVAFTFDIGAAEPFKWTQVFTSMDFGFYSKRQIITDFVLMFTMASVCLPLTAIVRDYKNMIDYCFTIFVIHFILVSCVINQFPVNGGFWMSFGVGLILACIFSERLSYQLANMSFKSAMQGPKYKDKRRSREELELPIIDDKQARAAQKSSDTISSETDVNRIRSQSESTDQPILDQATKSTTSSQSSLKRRLDVPHGSEDHISQIGNPLVASQSFDTSSQRSRSRSSSVSHPTNNLEVPSTSRSRSASVDSKKSHSHEG